MIIERRASLKGRKYHGYARWDGESNEIVYFLNKIGEGLRAESSFDNDNLVAVYFIVLDFHEWLHIYIKRKSDVGVSKTSDACERFVRAAHTALLEEMAPLCFPLSVRDLGYFNMLPKEGL